jgi:hypothetical protein
MAWYDEQPGVHQRAWLERDALASSREEVVSQKSGDGDEWGAESVSSTWEEAPVVLPHMRLQARSRLPERSNLTQPIPLPPVTSTMPTPSASGQGPRLAGRTTRVRLQAVHPEQKPEVSTGRMPAVDPQVSVRPGTYGAGLPPAQVPGNTSAPDPQVAGQPWPHLLTGRGMVRQGQGAVTVPNAAITERSVVTVMLAGNPGPVVVQYISLHPRMGFTVHLSSAATADAPFNYVVWPF